MGVACGLEGVGELELRLVRSHLWSICRARFQCSQPMLFFYTFSLFKDIFAAAEVNVVRGVVAAGLVIDPYPPISTTIDYPEA